jgi:hypothetical protein
MFRKSTARRGMSLEDRPVEQPHAFRADIGYTGDFCRRAPRSRRTTGAEVATFTEDLGRLADWLHQNPSSTNAASSTPSARTKRGSSQRD